MATARADVEISYALQEAAVQVCGTAFYYKGPLRALLARAGVPEPLVTKYWGESKFVMARSLLTELDGHGAAGANVQRRIIRELARVTPQDPDRRQEALDAIAELRRLAIEDGLLDDPKQHREQVAAKRRESEEVRRAHVSRARGLAELQSEFTAMFIGGSSQERGYALEDLLCRLFRLHDIQFEPSFRKGTIDQTDGFFVFEGFRYLVEARWRIAPPTAADLGAFASKVERRMKSTRGLYVSVAGFRQEVVDEVSTSSSLILMDGQDLTLVLEGRVSLVEALRVKINKASREGVIFYPLSRLD